MILVTGGTGMVGAHLLYQLTLLHEKVRAIKRDNSKVNNTLSVFKYLDKDANSLFKKIEWVDANILNINELEIAMQDIDTVYHCAAMVSFNPNDKKALFFNNVKGTANVVNSALSNNIKKFCHVSSIAAIGNKHTGEPVTEEIAFDPGENNSGYAASKYFSELEVWRGMAEGLNAIIVNPSVIIGAGVWNNGSPSFFKVINNNMPFYTNGVTGFVDVNDVCTAMIKLMDKDITNERFILSSENISYQEFFNFIADSLGKKRPSIYANTFMTELAWRFYSIASFITRKPASITKETARSSHNKTYFCSEKVKKAIDINFIPVKQSVEIVAKKFLIHNL